MGNRSRGLRVVAVEVGGSWLVVDGGGVSRVSAV